MPRGGKREGAGRPVGSGWKAKVGRLRDETIEQMTAIVGSDRDPLAALVTMALDPQLSIELRQNACAIALPFIYPKLTATTIDQRTTAVKIDANSLVEKLNQQIERLCGAPDAMAVIDASATQEATA